MAKELITEPTDDYELARDINVAYRRSRLNVIYYGQRLHTAQTWATWIDASIALGTSATVASLAVVHRHYGQIAFGFLVVVATVLAAVKPVLRLPDKIGRYGKLWAAYNAAFASLDRVSSDMRQHNRIRPQAQQDATAAVATYVALSGDEDPKPSKDAIRAARLAVEQEIPADRLWWPAGSTFAAAAASPVTTAVPASVVP